MLSLSAGAQRLSPGERRFLAEGVRQDVRADGRRRLEARPVLLECGLLPQANGSARVAVGGTEVVAAVRAELAEPDARFPARGRVAVAVEVWASARAALGPAPSPAAVAALDLELGAAVQRLVCAPGAVDEARLCLLAGRHVWSVFVDLVIVEAAGGALLDCCALAAHAALRDTRLPRLCLVAGEDGGEPELELDDDPAAFEPFPGAERVPVTVCFTQVGGLSVADADLAEEACASACTAVAVNRDGRVSAFEAGGPGGLQPRALHAAVEAAKSLVAGLFARADRAVAERAGAGADAVFMESLLARG